MIFYKRIHVTSFLFPTNSGSSQGEFLTVALLCYYVDSHKQIPHTNLSPRLTFIGHHFLRNTDFLTTKTF